MNRLEKYSNFCFSMICRSANFKSVYWGHCVVHNSMEQSRHFECSSWREPEEKSSCTTWSTKNIKCSKCYSLFMSICKSMIENLFYIQWNSIGLIGAHKKVKYQFIWSTVYYKSCNAKLIVYLDAKYVIIINSNSKISYSQLASWFTITRRCFMCRFVCVWRCKSDIWVGIL